MSIMDSWVYMALIGSIVLNVYIIAFPVHHQGIACNPKLKCPESSYCAIDGDLGDCAPCAMICTYNNDLHQSALCRKYCPNFTLSDNDPYGEISTTLAKATDASMEHHCDEKSTIIALSVTLGLLVFCIILIAGVIAVLKFKGILCFKRSSLHNKEGRTEQIPLQSKHPNQQNEEELQAADVSSSSSASHSGDQTDSETDVQLSVHVHTESVDVKTDCDDKWKHSPETSSTSSLENLFLEQHTADQIGVRKIVAPGSQDLSLVSDKKHTDLQFGQNTGPRTRHEGPNTLQSRSDVEGQAANSEETSPKHPHCVQESQPQRKLSNTTLQGALESETSAMTGWLNKPGN